MRKTIAHILAASLLNAPHAPACAPPPEKNACLALRQRGEEIARTRRQLQTLEKEQKELMTEEIGARLVNEESIREMELISEDVRHGEMAELSRERRGHWHKAA